jgi:hypothetical protein
MSQDDEQTPARVRWARLRFSIIGPLLASPPEPGEVGARIAELAQRPWRHPTTGEVIHLSAKTIERMYYAVRGVADPIGALERKVPKHAGTHPSVVPELVQAIEAQYRDHRGWNYQLHYDNLVEVAKTIPAIATMPAYATVRRFMKDHGMYRQKERRRGKSEKDAPEPREKRSYEVAHVNALWHYDFHEGKRKVLTASGKWQIPYLLGVALALTLLTGLFAVHPVGTARHCATLPPQPDRLRPAAPRLGRTDPRFASSPVLSGLPARPALPSACHSASSVA